MLAAHVDHDLMQWMIISALTFAAGITQLLWRFQAIYSVVDAAANSDADGIECCMGSS